MSDKSRSTDIYDAPLGFGIEYSWGDLYVTQQAEIVYGLAPLVDDVIRTVPTYAAKPKRAPASPSLSFLLTAPEEMGQTGLEIDDLAIKTELTPQSIESVFTVGATEIEVDTSLLAEDTEELIMDAPDPEVLHLLGRRRKHQVAQAIGYVVGGTAFEKTPDWWRNAHNERILRTIKDMPRDGIIAAMTLDLSHATNRESNWRDAAERLGDVVASEVHTSFCPHAQEASDKRDQEPPF